MRRLQDSAAILSFLTAYALIAGAQSGVSTTRESRTGMEFVRIAPGVFFMGCSDGDGFCDPDEKPPHDVRITKEFELGKYEVTQGQWRRVMDRNPSAFKGDNLPVDNVSWNDVQEFLKQMNARRDGYRYRLPTEAEFGPRTGEYRVMRGGAWGLIPYYLRLSYRDANVPTYKDNSIGFRCARERSP